MIRALNIALNAAHPELPLPEAVVFESSPTALFIRGVPRRVGKWALTAVRVAMTRPDGSVATRAAVESAGGVWTVTLPGSPAAGRTAAGLRIYADGEDETGAAVTGYVLGFADLEIKPLSAAPTPAPGTDAHEMWYYDEEPDVPRKGDVCEIDGALNYYDGEAWQSFGAGGTGDYADLSNKPTINNVTLSGNKTAAELGLATAAQGAKADTAYQKPQTGIPASDMTQEVQASLEKADVAPMLVPLGDGVWQLADANPGFVVIGGVVTVLPASKTSFADEEYANSQSLSFVYAANATSIGQYSFYDCDALTAVSLPVATSIGEAAFYGCDALTAVSLPAATSIDYAAFSQCDALMAISLPAATDFGYGVFFGCDALTAVSLPVATSIGESTFYGCGALTTVSLPTATSIGPYSFHGCNALTTIDLSSFTTAQVEANAADWGINPPSGSAVTIACSNGTITITREGE